MLECIYMNGRLRENQVTPANALGVFLAANQFMVPSLQKYCEKIIKDNIGTILHFLNRIWLIWRFIRYGDCVRVIGHYRFVVGKHEVHLFAIHFFALPRSDYLPWISKVIRDVKDGDPATIRTRVAELFDFVLPSCRASRRWWHQTGNQDGDFDILGRSIRHWRYWNWVRVRAILSFLEQF